ncbi:MAG: aspartate aminotransferase family protein [Clostridia bacterium]
MTDNDYKLLDTENIMNTYSRFNITLASGKNATATSVDGKKYIDFGSGIGVLSLGHCDKKWVKAITTQAKTIAHTSNLYTSIPDSTLAKSLCDYTGYDKVFFSNSGAEANECAIKIARKYSFDKYGKNRNEIITLKNSFHGRTITTLSATGQDSFHKFFYPFTSGFKYGDGFDLEKLTSKITDKTCAIMIELIQGEGGVIPLDKEFVKNLATTLNEKDILLIADEVQTGVMRTGKFLASEHYCISPDIVTLAKGLGGGLPIGATLCKDDLSTTLSYGMHGSTFGGNPICCAGAKVVLETVCTDEFGENVILKGDYIKQKLLAMSGVTEVRGLGLMIGFDVRVDTKTAINSMIENGLLVLGAKDSIRLLPPLTITMAEINKGLDIIEKSLNDLENK